MPTVFDQFHPEYEERRKQWAYTAGAYSGAYLSVPAVTGDGIAAEGGDVARAAQYLPRVPLGEHLARYKYMLATLDPDGLFPFALGSLAGQIAAVEGDAARVWAKEGEENPGPFGDPEDEGSAAARLLRDADGRGTNWDVLWGGQALDLLLYQRLWFAVEGLHTVTVPAVGPGGEPTERQVERPSHLRCFLPGEVPYWREENGLLVEVHTERKGEEDGKAVSYRYVYGIGGRQEWKRTGEGEAVPGELVPYDYYLDTGKRTPCPALFSVTIPLRYYVAFILARKAMSALNQRARGDVATLTSSVARLVHKSNTPTPTDGAHPFVQQVADGGSVHVIGTEEDVAYVSPDMGAASEARTREEEKRKAFAHEAYQRYSSEAAQVTATAVRQASRGGEGAILSLVSETLDEAENRALFLLAQAETPDRPELWSIPKVQRSKQFVVRDEAEETDRTAERVFGSRPVPIGRAGRKAAAMDYAKRRGLPVDPEEIDADLDAMEAAEGRVARLPGLEDFAPVGPEPEDAAGA